MSVWSLTAAAVLTGLTVGAQQSPPTTQITPPPPAITVEARQEDSSQRVSVDFNHAPVSEVLEWLSKNGASFIAADSELPKEGAITMSIKDQPIDEVVDALASALGGHWERTGGVRVFRHGSGGGFGDMRTDGGWTTAPEPPSQFRMAMPPGKFKVMKDGQKFFVTPDQEDGNFKVFTTPGDGEGNFKVFTTPGKENGNFKVFSDDSGKTFIMPDMKNFQMPDMKDLPDMKDMPDMEKLRAQLKQLKDIPGMSPEAQKEMMQALRESHDQMLKSDDEMKISQKAMAQAKKAMEEAAREHPEMKKEMEQAMEKARKAMEEARKEHPEAFGDGNTFFVSPDGKGKIFSFKTQDGSDFGKMGRSFTFKTHDFTKFVTSLSPDQKEMNRRQGYLRASDLTQSQRQMLGVPADGKGWSITIVKDGDSVTVKGDR